MHVQSLSQASSDIKYASNNFGACTDKLVVRQNFFKKIVLPSMSDPASMQASSRISSSGSCTS
jgi:hypothetical protein